MSKNKKKIFKARKGSRLSDKQAQIYGKRIDEIIAKKGGANPEDILQDAVNKSSPLHNYFEWDDKSAGMQYRLQQARDLTASIVIITSVDDVKTEQRAFFNVKNEDAQRVYVTLETAVATGSYRKQLIDQILRHLENTTVLLKLFKQADNI